jgi:hypothetical protein
MREIRCWFPSSQVCLLADASKDPNISGYLMFATNCCRYASEKLRANKAVVLAAVAKEGSMLQLASAGLRNDAEVVLAAVRQRSHVGSASTSPLQYVIVSDFEFRGLIVCRPFKPKCDVCTLML